MSRKKSSKKESAASKQERCSAEVQDKSSTADTPECDKSEGVGEVSDSGADAEKEGGDGYKERYVRLMADFDNYRKRQARDYEEMLKRSNERLLADLLPVTDNLELALKSESESESPFVAGVKLVYDQLVSLMARYHLTPIDAEGLEFDPHLHEALAQMPSASVEANMVIEQYRRGWKLNERLLRAAQVVVSSGAPEVGVGEQAEAEQE